LTCKRDNIVYWKTNGKINNDLQYVTSQTAHRIAELWHGIDSNVEKFPDECSICMRNEFVGGVKNGKRVQVGAWIYGQLARIGMFHAVLDEETMNLGLLTARNCTSELTV